MNEYNHIQVYVLKSQRPEIIEKHPNLTGEVTVPIYEFDTSKDFRYATDKQVKEFVEKRLKEKTMVNTSYSFDSREKVRVVQNYNIGRPVFEGEVSIPDKVVNISREYNNVGRVEVSK